GGRHHRRAREVALAADAHAVLPVPVERGDRALAFRQRVGSLTEAGAAPRLPDLPSRGAKHLGDRAAAEARLGTLDLALHPARAGKDDERPLGLAEAAVACGLDDERGLQQIVVAAVG